MDKSKELNDIFLWVEKQLEEIQYGEVGIKIILHYGKIKRIERIVCEKIQGV